MQILIIAIMLGVLCHIVRRKAKASPAEAGNARKGAQSAAQMTVEHPSSASAKPDPGTSPAPAQANQLGTTECRPQTETDRHRAQTDASKPAARLGIFLTIAAALILLGYQVLPDRPELNWPTPIGLYVKSDIPLSYVVLETGYLDAKTSYFNVFVVPLDQSASSGTIEVQLVIEKGSQRFRPCQAPCSNTNERGVVFHSDAKQISTISPERFPDNSLNKGLELFAVAESHDFGYVTNGVDVRVMLPGVRLSQPDSAVPVTYVRRLAEFHSAWNFDWGAEPDIDDRKAIGDSGMINADVSDLTWTRTAVIEGGLANIAPLRSGAHDSGTQESDGLHTFISGILLGTAGAAIIVSFDAVLDLFFILLQRRRVNSDETATH